jgi:hypothetical protein
MQEEAIAASDYTEPVSKLLTMGDCRGQAQWPDYLALGLGPEQIPDLIRMVEDDKLNDADSESLEVWAPIHARRALGQRRAETAVEPLLGLLWRIDEFDDDWVGEEIPVVLGMIGPAAVPKVAEYLADPLHGLWARVAAAHSLAEVGQRHPDARDDCVAVLSDTLEGFADHDPTLNGFFDQLSGRSACGRGSSADGESVRRCLRRHLDPGRLGGCPDRVGLAGGTPDACAPIRLASRAIGSRTPATQSAHRSGTEEARAQGRASPQEQAQGQTRTAKESAP